MQPHFPQNGLAKTANHNRNFRFLANFILTSLANDLAQSFIQLCIIAQSLRVRAAQQLAKISSKTSESSIRRTGFSQAHKFAPRIAQMARAASSRISVTTTWPFRAMRIRSRTTPSKRANFELNRPNKCARFRCTPTTCGAYRPSESIIIPFTARYTRNALGFLRPIFTCSRKWRCSPCIGTRISRLDHDRASAARSGRFACPDTWY